MRPLNTVAFEYDFRRFFCQETVSLLQDLEQAMSVSVEQFLLLDNPFNAFAFKVNERFFICQVELIFDQTVSKVMNLNFKLSSASNEVLYSKDKEFQEKLLRIEYQIVKKGLKVKTFMLSSEKFYVNTVSDEPIFGKFNSVRGEIFRHLLDTLNDTLGSLDFDEVEAHINDYIFYSSTSFPDLKKHFDRKLRMLIKQNQNEYFSYRNAVEEKEKEISVSGVNALNPDELGLNFLSMVAGIEYPAFLARHFRAV